MITLALTQHELNTLRGDLEFANDRYEETQDCDNGEAFRETTALIDTIQNQ